MIRRMLLAPVVAVALSAPGAALAQVEVEEFFLDNGMKFLLFPRSDPADEVAAGWVAHVGSVDERPGITGISHFFEHMMFKGTTTIGTSDPERDREFRQEQEQVRSKLRALQHGEHYERYRRGEITDPFDPEQDTPEMAALRAELKELMDAHKEVIVANEFDQIYRREGATGMNAFTSEDVTFYFITVPTNKLELWAWMESDRLTDSVFREFYAERDVVHEERRLRVESTPTGVYDEQLESLFWTASPYKWPVIGWPSDLESFTMEQAEDYFRTYYAPNNLTGVIVGDFDADAVKPMLERYFGHLQRGPEPPKVVTLEVEQIAERRMAAECDCAPQFTALYHTPAFGHRDNAALQVMFDVLNGRTGRIYRSVIEEQELATRGFARLDERRHAGQAQITLVGKEGVDPDALEAAWYRELDRLRNEPVGERELQKVKNQAFANKFRQMRSNFYALVQIGYVEHLGGWRYLNEIPEWTEAVTAEDVQRVANAYFSETNRTVGQYRRKAGTQVDPELAAALADLPDQAAQAVRAQLAELATVSDPDALQGALAQMKSQAAQVPPPMKPAFDYLVKKATERLDALKGGK